MNRDRVKILDRLFGLYLRKITTSCKMCGLPLDDTAQVSHCYGRANMAVRWDERNCHLVHDSCHRDWERMGRTGRTDLLVRWLGRNGAMALALDAASSRKWTASEIDGLFNKYKV